MAVAVVVAMVVAVVVVDVEQALHARGRCTDTSCAPVSVPRSMKAFAHSRLRAGEDTNCAHCGGSAEISQGNPPCTGVCVDMGAGGAVVAVKQRSMFLVYAANVRCHVNSVVLVLLPLPT